MLIDVEDPLGNLILNACFYSIVFLALVAVIPWKTLGAARVSQLLRWLIIPTFGLAVAYESAMPSRFDIRVDLLVLIPAYGLLVVTSIARWVAWNRKNSARRAP
jgi:hypothetical protein